MSIKKIVVAILVLFVFYSVNGQSKRGKVTYKVTRYIDKENESQKMFISMFEGYETISNEFEFSLMFDGDKSMFYLNDKLYSNKRAAEMALIYVKYFGRISQEKDVFITENLEEEFGRFLVKRPYAEWKLHDETKQIDNFLCFKATTSYTTSYKDKTFKHDITAWFTPKMPYKFGPIGYGNLPGLIIELQTKDATYGVSKIEFYKEGDKFKFPKLKKLKVISGEELEQLAAIYESKRRN